MVGGEVGVAEFGAVAFVAEFIEAGVDGDTGDPVFEGDLAAVLVEVREYFEEDSLGHICFSGSSGLASAHDGCDEGAESFHELVCGGFMAVDDLRDKVQVLVMCVTHALFVPDLTSLYDKTPVTGGCFTRNC